MTDLSEQLRHLADQHGDAPGSVTFADVTATRASRRRGTAVISGAVMATAAVTAFVLLRPNPISPTTALPTPQPTDSVTSAVLSAAAADVPVPQRVLDGLAAITDPTLSQGPRGAVAWLRTDARTAATFWPDSVRASGASTGDPGQQVFVVAVSVKNAVCADMGSCVRADGLMVGIVVDTPGGAIAPMAVLDIPRSFTENVGLHRFTVNGYPTGIADAIAPRVVNADPSGRGFAWVQWQQKPNGQYTLHLYGHYVCGVCGRPPGAKAPEGDMATITREADGTGGFDLGIAPADPMIEPGYTAVFLPPSTPTATPEPTTPASPTATPTVVENFGLGTHCGPLSLVYEGQYYARVGGKLSSYDPSWDFAVTVGTLTVTGKTAVFTDAAGHHETFEAAPEPTTANCR